MIHYFYGTLQVGIGQTLCSFEHVSCFVYYYRSRSSSEQGLFTSTFCWRQRRDCSSQLIWPSWRVHRLFCRQRSANINAEIVVAVD